MKDGIAFIRNNKNVKVEVGDQGMIKAWTVALGPLVLELTNLICSFRKANSFFVLIIIAILYF